MKSLQELSTYFKEVRWKSGKNGFRALCPCHDDKEPSLDVDFTNGKHLVICRAGCKTEEILHSVGLEFSDLMPDLPDRKRNRSLTIKEFAEWQGRHSEFKGAKFIASYEYRNNSGYAFSKCRISLPDDRKKTFRYCKSANGLVTDFKVKNRKEYGALYPFQQILEARKSTGTILYVEGEKDAENAIADGFHAVTAGGANDVTEYIVEHFEGLQVTIVPDNDEPGYKSAEDFATMLDSNGISARIIHWPESFTISKGDYSDFIDLFSNRTEGIAEFKKLLTSAVTLSAFRKERKQLQERNKEQERETIRQTIEDTVADIARQIRRDEAGKIFAVTDSKCGEMIARYFPKCRYNTTAKSWNYYDGKRWTLDAEGMQIERAAVMFEKALQYYSIFFVESADILPDDLSDFRKACDSLARRARRDSAIKDARKYNYFRTEDLDTDLDLLNCQNGILRLSTGELLPHDPKYMISKIAGAEYRPEIKRNDFPVFVDQIMQGDQERVRFIQKYFGYTLTGNPVLDLLVIFYGATTRNGKGTLCETLMRMNGEYGASIRPETLATQHGRTGASPSDDIARLAGIRFVNCSEPSKGMKFDEAFVKTLTGGDKITARHLYERSFEFYPQFSIVINTNYLPQITDTTLFSSGRIAVVPFDRHFEPSEQDRGLKARLREPENLSAVLNWAYEGYQAYKAEGLELPESVIKATNAYEEDSDKIRRFLTEVCEEEPGIHTSASNMYSQYATWCKDSGIYAEGKQTFFQMLRGRGLLLSSGTVDGKTVRNVVPGYKLPEWVATTNIDLPELPARWG